MLQDGTEEAVWLELRLTVHSKGGKRKIGLEGEKKILCRSGEHRMQTERMIKLDKKKKKGKKRASKNQWQRDASLDGSTQQEGRRGGREKLVLGLIRKPENPRSDSQGCWIKKIGCKCPIATLTTYRLSLLQGS